MPSASASANAAGSCCYFASTALKRSTVVRVQLSRLPRHIGERRLARLIDHGFHRS
jgi:hypothetical protein